MQTFREICGDRPVVAPAQLRIRGEDRQGKRRHDDGAARCPPSAARANDERREGARRDDRAERDARRRERQHRRIDARGSEQPQEDERGRHARGHRQQAAQRLALGHGGVRALIAPRDERIEAGEERRAGRRCEHGARADRRCGNLGENERRAAPARDEQGSHNEALQADSEVGREAQRRRSRRDNQSGESGRRRDDREPDCRGDHVVGNDRRDEREPDREHQRGQRARGRQRSGAREQAGSGVGRAGGDRYRRKGVQPIRGLNGRTSRRRPLPERASGRERRIQELIDDERRDGAEEGEQDCARHAPRPPDARRRDKQCDDRQRGRGGEEREFGPHYHPAVR